MIEGRRHFEIPEQKPAFAQWFVSIDISEWLVADTVQTVDFRATREDTGADATSVILDTAKCTHSGYYVKPYIRGGQPGVTYLIEVRIITNAGDQDSWFVRVDVLDYWLSRTVGTGLDAILISS